MLPLVLQKMKILIMDDTFTSDHFPIIMTIQYGFAPTDFIYPKRRWNISEKLFPKYTSYLESLYDSPRETSSAEEKVEYCVTCIRKAADAIFRINQPFSPNKRYVPPWWDVECTNIIEKRKQILKEYKKNRTLSNYLRVRETLAYSKRFLKKKKKDSWRTFCSGLSSNTPIAEVWNTLKKLNRTNVSYTKMEDDLANLFLLKLTPDSVIPEITITPNSVSNHIILKPFLEVEFSRVLASVKDSAPGVDDITYEILRHLSIQYKKLLIAAFNQMWVEGEQVSVLKTVLVVPILKPNKSPGDIDAYRPIALMSVLKTVLVVPILKPNKMKQ
ncbi:hypothetical protein QE152_g31951 [Popillia japonica]|uniref:Uncharacterized protein n=1 Tax=Popillia japonica TaxID=7064 RepID=A0AAW1J1E1_POPJA